MVFETIGFFVIFFLLGIIGLGPALLALETNEKRILYAFALAPAVGYVIILLLGFPLVRYAGTIPVWAIPLTVVGVLVTLAILLFDIRKNPSPYRVFLREQMTLPVIAFFIVCYLVIPAPLLINGIRYAIFRSNPSDAFLYMNFAQTFRLAPWSTILNGISLEPNNIAGVQRLAELAPIALFSVRGMVQPPVLGKMIVLGWESELLQIPTYRFYFASHLLALGLMLPLALVIGDLLHAPRWLKYLAAAAVAFGLWARVPIENDAGYEVSIAPVVLLFIVAWILLENQPLQLLSRARVFFGFTIAGLGAAYLPPSGLLILGAIFYYAAGLLQRVISFKVIFYHLMSLAIAFVILLLTGQLDYLVRYWLFILTGAEGQNIYPSTALRIIQSDGIQAIWGLPREILFGSLRTLFQLPLRALADVLAVAMSLALVATPLFVFRKTSSRVERIIFSMVLAGIAFILFYYLTGRTNLAGRAFNYSFSFVIFSLLIFTSHIQERLPVSAVRVAVVLVAIWLLSQALLAIYIPFNGSVTLIQHQPITKDYDLTPITSYLDQHPPQELLVAVPKTHDWQFAYYAIVVFSRYPTHFQSGIVIDNTLERPALWFDPLQNPPDYAVILKDEDYIGAQGLGTPVAQTKDLILYKITSFDLTAFNTMEEEYKARDGYK